MRKFLSLLMVAMLAFNAWAASESVDFTAQGYSNQQEITSYEGTDFTVTFNKGTNSNVPKYYTTGAAIRFYGGSYFTVSSAKTISKIVITFGSGDGSNAITTDVETYSNGTWTGSATSVKFTIGGTSGHRRIAGIDVTFDDGTTPVVTVTPPTFSPVAGEVEAGTAVTISAPAAEMIVYTTDGTNPSYANNVGDIYTEPIVVNEAMTIKAIAVDANENESAVATATYTIKPQAATVATVAEFNALGNNIEFTFSGNLVVSGQKNNYLYAQDATGGILIYGTAGQTYDMGAVIPAGWAAKKAIFNGAPEATNMTGMQAATETAELVAEEMTPAQVTVDNAFKYAVIKGATIENGKLVVGNESVTLYNSRFNVDVPTDGGVYDVTGITGFYNNPQFMPLEFVAQATEVATPVITGETPFIGSTTVTITCEEEGATVYYTIDGTEPTNQSTEYTEPFELNETATVKAIAYDVTGATSTVVSKEFVKTLTVATVAEALALDDNTEFVFTGNLVVSAQSSNTWYLYAQDETGGILIYSPKGYTLPEYAKGDVIPAGFGAKFVKDFKGAPEFTNPTGFEAATETAEIEAEAITPAEVTVDPYNLFKYNVIKGATITTGEDGKNYLTVGEDNVVVYDRFNVEVPADLEKTYDVYGIAGWYDGAQFMPLEFVEAVEPVVESFISYTAQQERGTVAVTLEDGTAVESLVTKVAEGTKFTVTATAAQGYMVTNIEVKAGEIVITPTTDDPYNDEFGAPALKAEGAREMSQTFEMPADDVAIYVTFDTRTGIENINMDNVKAVRFFNAAGVESATPFQGVNIVVREMNDGSKVVTKMVK